MSRKSLFATIAILLALVLVGCGPALDETQTATSVPSIELETDSVPSSNEQEPASIVTQLPFDENSLIGYCAYSRRNVQ